VTREVWTHGCRNFRTRGLRLFTAPTGVTRCHPSLTGGNARSAGPARRDRHLPTPQGGVGATPPEAEGLQPAPVFP
jgi:hypothetical protein